MIQPVVPRPLQSGRQTRYAAGDYYFERIGTRQKAPYNIATSYARWYATTESLNLVGNGLYPGYIDAPGEIGSFGIGSFAAEASTLVTWANNSAYDKFVDQVRKEAMLAVNFAERHQAMDMLYKRTDQLVRAVSAMRRGNWRRVGDILNVSVPPKLQKRSRYRGSRELANTFLEYHFGWEPLVKDIGTAIDILKGPAPAGRVRARSRTMSRLVPYHNLVWNTEYSSTRRDKVYGVYSGHVYVSNPNLYLANQLGLVNPAAIAWELVPYSFVIDWFTNVGQFLSSYTDFLGLSLVNTCFTYVVDTTWQGNVTYFSSALSATQRGNASYRSPTTPSVRLAFRPPRPLGTIRGITAISLLLQKLPRV